MSFSFGEKWRKKCCAVRRQAFCHRQMTAALLCGILLPMAKVKCADSQSSEAAEYPAYLHHRSLENHWFSRLFAIRRYFYFARYFSDQSFDQNDIGTICTGRNKKEPDPVGATNNLRGLAAKIEFGRNIP